MYIVDFIGVIVSTAVVAGFVVFVKKSGLCGDYIRVTLNPKICTKNMKGIIILFVGILLSVGVSAQESNPNFDKNLAAELGADDYGMKTYVFVLLKTGENKSTDESLRNESFSAHFSNMRKIAKEGKLALAGPMLKNENNYRGIFIFNVSTIEEAQECVKNDLAIQNGFLQPEFYLWYGSAALPRYLPFDDKIWTKKP